MGTPRVEARALRGVPWSVLAYAATRGVSLLGTLALARLLAPGDLGVFFTGMVVIAVANLVSDTGLGAALVVRDEVGPRLLGTAFVCMVGVASVLAVAIAVGAGLIADAFDTPRLGDVLPYLAVTAVFTTGGYFFLTVLQRELLFQRRFAGQIAQAVAYVAVAVPAAIAGAGIWSLVAGMVAGSVLSAIVLWRVTPGRVRPTFDLGSARLLYREARPFLSQAASSFVGYNLHLVAVASVLGPRVMGVYSLSFRLAELPHLAITTPVSQATFPAFARLRSESERRKAALLTSVQYVSLLAFPVSVGLAVLAEPFAHGVLGSAWSSMPPVLIVLSAWGTVAVVTGVLAWFINALGEAPWLAKINLRFALTAPAAFVLASVFDSAVAVAGLLVLDISVELVLLVRHAHRTLDLRVSELLGALRSPALAAVGLGAAALAVSLVLEAAGASAVVRLAAGAAAGIFSYCAVIYLTDRPLLSQGRELLLRAIGPGGSRVR